MPKKSSRRAFLRGKSAADALADLPDRLLPAVAEDQPSSVPPSAARSPDEATYLVQIARDAMACEFQVFLNAGQHSTSTEAALEALDLIEQLEDQLSVYRQHTELTRINQLAGQQEVPVESQLFELLCRAREISEQTEGAFDISAVPLGKVWGFHRRAGRFPQPEQIADALAAVGYGEVKLDVEHQTIRFARPGMEINVNAIGKGYALDRAAQQLLDQGVSDFLIHGGQSSLLAHGSRAGQPEENQGWSVAVRHPLRHDQRLAELWLRDQALGTSGSGNQFFHFQGQRYGHVIDPRNGYPAAKLLSATILAPSAAVADAVSTAAFVLGPDKTLELCERRGDLSALLVAPGQRAGEIELITGRLPDDIWRRVI